MIEDTVELDGKRIVVVEDDFLLASDLCRELRNLGAVVLGPAPTPFYAMQLINHKRIDAAVLDVRLHGTTVFDVADMLEGQGVPILFTTASAKSDLPHRYQATPMLEKPVDRTKFIAQIIEMTRRRVRKPVETTFAMPVLDFGDDTPVQAFAKALSMRWAGR